jgi:hypothetical protein
MKFIGGVQSGVIMVVGSQMGCPNGEGLKDFGLCTSHGLNCEFFS